MQHPPTPDGIPLLAQTAHLPDGTAATRLDTPTAVILTLGLGRQGTQTAPDIVALFDDALLAAICAIWGIHAPIEEVRKNPIWALGPLANMIISPDLIPEHIARQRA